MENINSPREEIKFTSTNNKHTTGRKRDNARNYFIEKNGKFICNVEECKKVFSLKTSVAILKNHLFNSHGENLYNNIKSNNIIKDINMNEQELKENKIIKKFAVAFAKNSLPHSLLDEKSFKKALESLNGTVKISKSRLRECIIFEGESINNNVLDMLCLNDEPVTIAIDSWTNVNSNKVINILLICSGIPYYYTSIENTNNFTNVEWLVPQLEEKIDFLIKKNIKIIGITTDNENLMKNVREKLKIKFPVLIIIPCSAHILQLSFKQLCCCENIKDVIDDSLSLINIIRKHKTYRIKLYELQKNDNIAEPLKLIYPIEIRWTSLINTIERLVILKKYVKDIDIEKKDISDNIKIKDNKKTKFNKNKEINIDLNFWDKLNLLHNFLKPFSYFINKIQKDNASLYSIWENFNKITKFLNSDEIPLIFNKSIAINDIFKEKWNKHIDINLIESSRLFNLEKKFKYDKSTLNFIKNWGAIYLSTYKIIENNNIDNVKDILEFQLNEFITKQNDFLLINNKNENLKKICKDNNKQYNIKLLWNAYLLSHYELVNVVNAILSLCPSESSVERSFSIQSNVHSLERNRLSNELIDAEMNIKMNMKIDD